MVIDSQFLLFLVYYSGMYIGHIYWMDGWMDIHIEIEISKIVLIEIYR